MRKKVVVAGGAGLIGKALVAKLAEDGLDPIVLTRRDPAGNPRLRQWDGRTLAPWASELADAVAVINLAGESISQKWTPEARKAIIDSRLDSVAVVGEALRDFAPPSVRWINASAIGYYGDRGPHPVDESSPPGTGFLAESCVRWEKAVVEHAPTSVRTCRVRIGVVLATDGGAYPVLAKVARYGLGGHAGSGRQGLSWIHLYDLVRAFRWLVDVPELPPVVNGTAPVPVSNAQFMRSLRKSLHVPLGLPSPRIAMVVANQFGAPDPALILEGCFAEPRALLESGMPFRFTNIERALEALTKKTLV